MEQNVAKWDRILRAIAGIVLLGVAILYTSTIGQLIAIIVGTLGAIMLMVAVTGFCPIYKIIGWSTLKATPTKKAPEAKKKTKKK